MTPWKLASAIAATFGGEVVGGNSRLRIYQLRFMDEELDELRQLGGHIAELPNVTTAGPHYVGRFDPDW